LIYVLLYILRLNFCSLSCSVFSTLKKWLSLENTLNCYTVWYIKLSKSALLYVLDARCFLINHVALYREHQKNWKGASPMWQQEKFTKKDFSHEPIHFPERNNTPFFLFFYYSMAQQCAIIIITLVIIRDCLDHPRGRGRDLNCSFLSSHSR